MTQVLKGVFFPTVMQSVQNMYCIYQSGAAKLKKKRGW